MQDIKISNYSKMPNIILLLSAFIKEHDHVALYFTHEESLPQTILPYLQRMHCKTEMVLSNSDIVQQLYHLNPVIFITESSNQSNNLLTSENNFKDMLVIKIFNYENPSVNLEDSLLDIVQIEDINSGENSWFGLSQSSKTERALQKLNHYDLVKVSIGQKNSDSR